MSIHINAKENQIAETILLPGDPLRAKYIAENFLEDIELYNDVRGMYGYTGTYLGERISVQGTGMGVPSISIYVNELMTSYNVQKLVRVGSCGAISKELNIRDIILAQGASTDSQMNRITFGQIDYAPLADFSLLHKAYDICLNKNLKPHVGNVFTTDLFYKENAAEIHQLLNQFNVLAIEMETTALYTLAAKFNRQALSILTVSDHVITGEETTAKERETSFNEMIEIALATVL